MYVATPLAVSCLLATLAAVDIFPIDGSICVEVSVQLKLKRLTFIHASENVKVAPVGPCKYAICRDDPGKKCGCNKSAQMTRLKRLC